MILNAITFFITVESAIPTDWVAGACAHIERTLWRAGDFALRINGIDCCTGGRVVDKGIAVTMLIFVESAIAAVRNTCRGVIGTG